MPRRTIAYDAEQLPDGELAPERPAPGLLYLECVGGVAAVAVMACPCGCGEVLRLNLRPVHETPPVWTYTDTGTPSLHPEVRTDTWCCSRFSLVCGEVRWC